MACPHARQNTTHRDGACVTLGPYVASMRVRIGIFGLALSLMAIATPAMTHADGGTSVTIHDNGDPPSWGYTAQTTTVAAGQTVTWTNSGQYPHDAAATDGSWKVPILPNGGAASYTFTTPGTYTYICSPHPWMQG